MKNLIRYYLLSVLLCRPMFSGTMVHETEVQWPGIMRFVTVPPNNFAVVVPAY
jgi:hypothetical protein